VHRTAVEYSWRTMSNLATDATLEEIALAGGRILRQKGLMLTVAESCTGGWIAQAITSIEGSSGWFERGFVTYTNISKREMLGVSATTLARQGAVSEATVRAMAEGALAHSHADVALAVTGIAGPGGGSAERPVGTVWIAWAGKHRDTIASRYSFTGERAQVRRQSVVAALAGMIDFLGA
jgi:nicotinamide-nucleotide amidase